MPPITQEQLLDALELGSAAEFFDIMRVHVDDQLTSTINDAFVQLSMVIFDDSGDLVGLIKGITAAQWSAFSAGWTIRGLVDGKQP